MELSLQLSVGARQLEALITTHWDALPAAFGMDLQLLAEQMSRWAAQAAGPAICPTLAGNTASAQLRHIDRELAAIALNTANMDGMTKMDLHNHARRIADVAAAVEAMEERLRPPTARELTGNVVPLPRRLRALPAGGNAA